MADYKKMYTTLFNAITDALRLMEDEKVIDRARFLYFGACRNVCCYGSL